MAHCPSLNGKEKLPLSANGAGVPLVHTERGREAPDSLLPALVPITAYLMETGSGPITHLCKTRDASPEETGADGKTGPVVGDRLIGGGL